MAFLILLFLGVFSYLAWRKSTRFRELNDKIASLEKTVRHLTDVIAAGGARAGHIPEPTATPEPVAAPEPAREMETGYAAFAATVFEPAAEKTVMPEPGTEPEIAEQTEKTEPAKEAAPPVFAKDFPTFAAEVPVTAVPPAVDEAVPAPVAEPAKTEDPAKAEAFTSEDSLFAFAATDSDAASEATAETPADPPAETPVTASAPTSAPTHAPVSAPTYAPTYEWPHDRAHDREQTEPASAAAYGMGESVVGSYIRTVVGFIRGGNIWVTGGVIMLLLGFAFLAQLGVFPIELRIAGAALAGMAMVGGGIWLRLKRPMYALILQGGGIGILYLSAFASAKLTDILPPAAALVIMTALIIPAVALAILQNAQALALVGFLGGFAAPILLSDGSGNYVALFSCYTLLNLGIFAITRFKLWRWLNLAGALSSFVVMGYWGVRSYDVSMFSSVEPFLLAFVLIYIGITLVSVRKKEFSFSEPLDMILACSVPFVAAVFQWRLASGIPHGLSISAVAFGAFFILLAIMVWKFWGEGYRRLAEFYLANGVVLANLAIPLEVSGNVTSAVWAVEGAVLFFFACRIRSPRIKVVALLLQVVGVGALGWAVLDKDPNAHTLLASSLVSLAALASACFHKRDVDDPTRETPEALNVWLGDLALERLLVLAGLFWWYAGIGFEAYKFADQPLVMFFLAASASSALWYVAERYTGLRDFLGAAVVVPLASAFCCLLVFSGGDYLHRSSTTLPARYSYSAWKSVEYEARLFLRYNFLTGWSAAAWAAFAVTQFALLKLYLSRVNLSRHAWWAGAVILALLAMLTSSGRGAALDLGLSPAWGHLASIFPAVLYTLALTWMLRRYVEGRAGFFTADHARVLGGSVPALLFIPLGVWLFFSFFSQGRTSPLPFYVPLLNPLELKQALCIACFAMWQRAVLDVKEIRFSLPVPKLLLLIDGLVFVWLHSMLFRAIYHFTGIPMHRAWDHESFQVLLTVLWGVWGMAHLIIGNRRRIRLIWVIGASLMLMDTAKLFLVDLADKGTLFRVISFFVMGGIFLLIGWLAPLPPSAGKPEYDPEHGPEHGSEHGPEHGPEDNAETPRNV
ncbi:MAG: hypothetical protein DELT_02918 [Desulfovibrio sp.]